MFLVRRTRLHKGYPRYTDTALLKSKFSNVYKFHGYIYYHLPAIQCLVCDPDKPRSCALKPSVLEQCSYLLVHISHLPRRQRFSFPFSQPKLLPTNFALCRNPPSCTPKYVGHVHNFRRLDGYPSLWLWQPYLFQLSCLSRCQWQLCFYRCSVQLQNPSKSFQKDNNTTKKNSPTSAELGAKSKELSSTYFSSKIGPS